MTVPEPTVEYARNLQARSAAQAALERLTTTPTGIVRYTSRGRTLVIGAEPAQWFAARVESPMHAEVLLTGGEQEPGAPTVALANRDIRITGHLGAFRVELGRPGTHAHQVIETDLIVDFSDRPLLTSELPPPGYWHFGSEPDDLDTAWLAIDGMVGTFEKPKYFEYDPSICAHRRAGQDGCQRCLDACPADAIISIGEQIEVNPNLCQGGGICASVCPSGAIRYAYPSPVDSATRIRTLLRSYLQADGHNPVILFVAEADVVQMPRTPPNVLLAVVEELASVGHELWLAALAWGAQCVMLADAGSVPTKARRALDEQIRYAHEILEGLGYPRDALRSLDASRVEATCSPVDGLPAPASFAATGDKRQMAALAIGHLSEHAEQRVEAIPLSTGAPYGRLRVDGDKCTLCMSCTSVCPAGALSAGDDVPRVVMHEVNCVQCGICANACPENAIRLEARLLVDPEQRRQAITLHEEPPFCCIACGKPFATRRVIDNILSKLAGHAMFQSERARRRLQMCEDCRVVDAVQDNDAMQAGLSVNPQDPAENEKSE